MAKLILGIAGEMGSGKEAISKHVVNTYNASAHNFSQILTDILHRLHLEITRENQASLSTMLRKNFSENILAKTLYFDVTEDNEEIVVVQGIRRIEEMELLKQMPNFKLLFIDVQMDVRFERISKRKEKVSDGTISFQEFEISHQNEADKKIPDLKNYADFVIDNNGGYPELYKQVDEIVNQNM